MNKMQPKRKEIIRLENVYFSYDNKEFLKDISFSIYENDFLGIIGPNGGGKTTLIRLILGLLEPKRGEIKVFGENPRKGRMKIGYLSQFKDIDFQFPITSSEIILQGLIGKDIFKRYTLDDKKLVEKVMKKLDIWKYKDKNLHELSGGEKQRVFIARAIVNEPKAVILDEPLTNLDMHIQEELYNLLKNLNKQMAVIIIDHNLQILSKFAKEIVCINKCKTNTIRYHESDKINLREKCNN